MEAGHRKPPASKQEQHQTSGSHIKCTSCSTSHAQLAAGITAGPWSVSGRPVAGVHMALAAGGASQGPTLQVILWAPEHTGLTLRVHSKIFFAQYILKNPCILPL